MTDSSWQQIESGTGRWWIEPDWRERLLQQGMLRLDEWAKQGKIEVIKDSVHRTIYRVDLPHRPVFIKHYPVKDWLSWIRQRLRPAKAWKEWQLARLLRDQAIPTITPVAVGIFPNGESYLVSEEIQNAVQLYQYVRDHWFDWKRRGRFDECHALARELGVFLARMYQAGIAHRDLHPWNVLIRCSELGREWFLIDPYEINSAGNDTKQRDKHLLKSFMLMSLALWPLAAVKERMYCWRSFRAACSEWQPGKNEERRFLTELEGEVWRNSFSSWKSRSWRCVQTNREFYSLRKPLQRTWVSRDIPEDWMQQLLSNPDDPFHASDTKILKTSRHAQVALIRGPSGECFIYKKFVPRNNLDRWISLCRPSPARHCHKMAYRLELAYLPTAKPLAAIEVREKGYLQASYQLTGYVTDTADLATFFTLHGRIPSVRRAIIQQVIALVHRLHRYRLSHRDMKAVNFLVHQPQGSKPKVYLVDLRGVHFHRWLTQTRRIKDLARLTISALFLLKLTRTEMLRGLCLYLGKERSQWRWWWKQIALHMRKKMEQNVNRNRILS
jgi:tRNA A-37 threonylcarbamoyl transferase component Bud32